MTKKLKLVYKADFIRRKVLPLEYHSETGAYIKTVGEVGHINREQKRCSSHEYYDKYDNAKSALIAHLMKKIATYNRQINYYKEKLKEVEDTHE